MLPTFLVEETTVRESGESAVFDANEYSGKTLLLTLGVTHAIEHESIGVEIHGSKDGLDWPAKPMASLTPKFYCGTYQLVLPKFEARYLKARWRVMRWSRDDRPPFFSFYVFAEAERVRAAGAA
jgi:hypothetical protein